MAYVSREIKDRVAIGDNCFYMEELEDGRITVSYTHLNWVLAYFRFKESEIINRW